MKTVLELLVWMFLLTYEPSKQECLTELKYDYLTTTLCTNTNFEDFMYDFVHSVNSNSNSIFRHSIAITNSDFVYIHFFALPLPKKCKLIQFSLTKSSVEVIEDHAFEEFVHLTVLDLSHNNLDNMTFIRTLPSNIETLLLNDNKFEAIENVLGSLPSIQHLDLSNCRIGTIDPYSFLIFTREAFINLRNNSLTSFDVIFKDDIKLEADLSLNGIRNIDTKDKRIYFRSLNASYNRIESISDISCRNCHYYRKGINFIDLSFNDLRNKDFLNFFSGVRVENLNLSHSEIDENFDFKACQEYVSKKLDLSNNKIQFVKPKMFGDFQLTQLNLFNSSITSISEIGFSDCTVSILNISSNLMTELKNRTFDNCRISELDISRCLIQTVEPDAFLHLYLSHTLDLSHNKISYIHGKTFQNLSSVDVIDLSFNFLKIVRNDLFRNCHNLDILYLSNSEIEVVENEAFSGKMQLRELHLENNHIKTIDFHTVTVTGVLYLLNNKFDALEFSFLHNSSAVIVLLNNNNRLRHLTNNSHAEITSIQELDLSNSKVINIDTKAFQGLHYLKFLNLSNNNVQTIHPKVFFPLKKLKWLDLRGNRLVTFSPSAFCFGNRLEQLGVSFSGGNHLFSNNFITFNYLKIMNISDTKSLSLRKNCFKGLMNLETFNLNKVDVLEINPGAFDRLNSLQSNDFQTFFKNINIIREGTFTGLTKLDDLDLSNLNISFIETEAFIGLTNLQKLFLQLNGLTKIVNNTFSGLSSLKTLNLSHNTISTLESNAFFGLVNLEVLTMRNNNLTKLVLGTFQEFPNLRILNLRRNYINQLLTGTFSNLKLLQELNLSYNNITKLKMQNFMPLTGLTRLDLTGNHLIVLSHLDLVKSFRQLKYVGINGNKWKCDNLATMLIAFRNSSISWWTSENVTFRHENIDGIKCYNICKFFYCADEADDLWRDENNF